MNKPPIWFQEFEKRNNSIIDNIENKINAIEEKVDNNTKLINKYHE